jgi:hypothetical protein
MFEVNSCRCGYVDQLGVALMRIRTGPRSRGCELSLSKAIQESAKTEHNYGQTDQPCRSVRQ